MKLIDKKIVVIGAAGGIGTQLVCELLKNGATVWSLDAAEEALFVLAQKTVEYGSKHHTKVLDINNLEELNALKEDVLAGPVDILINCCAYLRSGLFIDIPLAESQKTAQTCFTGLITSTLHFLDDMHKNGTGTIVNILSIGSKYPTPIISAYSAAKAGSWHFHRSLQNELELMDSKVKLVAVFPGFVRTNLLKIGRRNGFPRELSWIAESPEKIAGAIVSGIKKDKSVINPSFGGLMTLLFAQLFGWTLFKIAKYLNRIGIDIRRKIAEVNREDKP